MCPEHPPSLPLGSWGKGEGNSTGRWPERPHCWVMTGTGVPPSVFRTHLRWGSSTILWPMTQTQGRAVTHSPPVLSWVRDRAGTRTQGSPAMSFPVPAPSCRGKGPAAAGGG